MKIIGTAVIAGAVSGIGGFLGGQQAEAAVSDEKTRDLTALRALAKSNVAYGGGLSLLGPFKGTNGNEVFLRSIFAYGPEFVLCTVEDNPEGFIFPTAEFGEVPLDPHTFFMYMGASHVESAEYSEQDGRSSVTIKGVLGCNTEAITASATFGGREAAEPADFEAVAIDGTDFWITVLFNKDAAPINNAIFGPKFTFRGKIVDGKMTVGSLEAVGKI